MPEVEDDMKREELLTTLRQLLSASVEARFEGGRAGKLERAHGVADGYMRALLDAGLVEQDALLQFVCDERLRIVSTAN